MEENQKRNQLRAAREKLEKTRKHLFKVEREMKQMRKAQYRMSEDEIREHQAQNRRLVFGLKFISTYKKHETQNVDKIFWNPNSRAFVTYNDKFIHVWSPKTSQQLYNVDVFAETKAHAIQTLSYSAKNWLYFLISNDFKCHIFNESLILIKTLPMGMRPFMHSHFNDAGNVLIASGAEGVFLYKLNYSGATDMKHTHKLDPLGTRLKFSLKLFQRLDGVDRWVKGSQIDSEMDLLFAWSLTQTSVYRLSTGELHFTLDNLVDQSEDLITDLLYMPKYRYIVMSTVKGKLQVYKWAKSACEPDIESEAGVEADPRQSKPQMVTEFKGMTKAINSLQRHPHRINQFITASVDQTLRIWCLEKFTCQYVLKIPLEIKNIKLMSHMLFACFERNQIQIGRISDIALMMHKSQTDVRCSGQCFIDMERKGENWPYALFTQFKDNSIKLLAPKAVADVKVKSTIYPPPNAEEIVMVRFCTILKQIIVFVRSGMLYFYRLEQGTSVLVKQVNPSHLRDADQSSLDQKLITFEIGCVKPPVYDCQKAVQLAGNIKRQDTWHDQNFAENEEFKRKRVASQSSDTSMLDTDTEERETIPEDQYMILGFHRGQVIIYNIHRLDVPISRHEVGKHKIIMLREVTSLKQYLILDDTHTLTLCALTNTGTKYLQQVNLFRPLFEIIVHKTLVYFAYQTGDIDFFKVLSTQEIRDKHMLLRRASTFRHQLTPAQLRAVRRNQIKSTSHSLVHFDVPKVNDSEDSITAITLDPLTGYLASADKTNLIKIWSAHKQLIREIQFPEQVHSLCFIDYQGDLMIGHGQTLSMVKASQYLTDPNQVKEMTENELLTVSQDVSNDLMYNIFLKETGTMTQEEKDKTRDRMLDQEQQFAAIDETNSSTEREETKEFDQANEVDQAQKSIAKAIQQDQARRKQVAKMKAKLIDQASKGRDLTVEKAAKQSEELAQKAIEDAIQQEKIDESIRLMKEKKKLHAKKLSSIVVNHVIDKKLKKDSKTKTAQKGMTAGSVSLPKVPVTKQSTQQSIQEISLYSVPTTNQITDRQEIPGNEHMKSQPNQSALESMLSVPDDFKYDATTPAIPLEVTQENYNKIFQGRLHPRRQGQSIRREMTERRISTNIVMFNQATALQDAQDLFIGQPKAISLNKYVNASTEVENTERNSIFSMVDAQVGPGQGTIKARNSSVFNAKNQNNQAVNRSLATSVISGGYSTQELQRMLRRKTNHRKLISELKQRNSLLTRKPSKLQYHKRGAGSMQQLSKADSRITLGLGASPKGVDQKGAAAYDSLFQNSFKKRVSRGADNSMERSTNFDQSTKDANDYFSKLSQGRNKSNELPMIGVADSQEIFSHQRSGSVIMLSNIGNESRQLLQMENSKEMIGINKIDYNTNPQIKSFEPMERPTLPLRQSPFRNNVSIDRDSPLKITASNLFIKQRPTQNMIVKANADAALSARQTFEHLNRILPKKMLQSNKLTSNFSEQSNDDHLTIYPNATEENTGGKSSAEQTLEVLVKKDYDSNVYTFSKFVQDKAPRNAPNANNLSSQTVIIDTAHEKQ